MEFKNVEMIRDCRTFEELESEFEELIFYADGSPDSVTDVVKEEGFQGSKALEYYFFDDWAIAIWVC